MGFLYMMVRLPNEDVLQKIITSVVAENLPFSVSSQPEGLVAMAKQQFGFGENDDDVLSETANAESILYYNNGEQHAEDLMEEDIKPLMDIATTSNLESEATFQASPNGEVNAIDLLLCEEEIKPPSMDTVTVGDLIKNGTIKNLPRKSRFAGLKEASVKRNRSPNNIKRYRKQECQMCHKFFVVPFWKTKIQHAAVHSEFQRYACIFCPKRVVHSFTIRSHVAKFHPFVEKGGRTGVGYQDLMTEKEQEELEELTRRCFPEPTHGSTQQ